MSEASLNLVIALVGIVIGAAVSYYFYRLSKKEPLPMYCLAGNVVVTSHKERDIKVQFRGKDVPVVTRTMIAFWNAGREPIRREDLRDNHPLTVKLPEGAQLLDARVLTVTRPEVDFACFPDETYRDVRLGFSFLNRHDGGIVEILHTATDPRSPIIEGAIVGVDGPPLRVEDPFFGSPRHRQVYLLSWSVALAGGLGWASNTFLEEPTGQEIFYFLPMIILGLLGLAAMRLYWRNRKRRVERAPKDLREVLWPAS
jgi:hypothetical protein